MKNLLSCDLYKISGGNANSNYEGGRNTGGRGNSRNREGANGGGIYSGVDSCGAGIFGGLVGGSLAGPAGMAVGVVGGMLAGQCNSGSFSSNGGSKNSNTSSGRNYGSQCTW